MKKCPPPVSQVSSQASSVSSCDDYIILPDCFDTSRPLGESTQGSAASAVTSADKPQEEEKDDPTLTAQRGREEAVAEESSENTWPPAGPPGSGSMTQLLCTSQTLDTVMLTPEVMPAPVLPPVPLLSPPALYSPRLEMLNEPSVNLEPADPRSGVFQVRGAVPGRRPQSSCL